MFDLLAPSEAAYLFGDRVTAPRKRSPSTIAVLTSGTHVRPFELAMEVTLAAVLGLVRHRVVRLAVSDRPNRFGIRFRSFEVEWGDAREAPQLGACEATLLDALTELGDGARVEAWLAEWNPREIGRAAYPRILRHAVMGLMERDLVHEVLADTGAGRPLPVRTLTEAGRVATAATGAEGVLKILSIVRRNEVARQLKGRVRTALTPLRPPSDYSTSFDDE